jgi:serine protease AprX
VNAVTRFVSSGLLALVVTSAAGATLPARLDPRLAPALADGAAPVAVWIEFADKGEQGPADLAAKLARAQSALTPRTLARRERNGVWPLVDYLDLPVAPEYLASLRARGFTPYGVSRWFNGCSVRTSGTALSDLADLAWVRRVSPAPLAAPRAARPEPGPEIVRPAPPPGSFGARGTAVSYGLTANEMSRMMVTALHDSGYSGAGVLVCMCDEGYNYYNAHDATKNLDVGNRTRDFVRGGTDVQDRVFAPTLYQHGQWTLSTLGGNAPGAFVGPAYGASFALARTEDSGSEKPIEMVNWLMASEWADSLGADIISSSLGYFDFPDSAGTSLTYSQLDGHTSIITRAVEIAAAKGILVVNSAGNGGAAGLSTLNAPADADGDSMLAVGAVDSLGVRASFSSNGPTADGRIKPDVMAQGVRVWVASASGALSAYTQLNGTSFSCPLTAGIAACLMQARPTWRVVDVVHALKRTASRASIPDNFYGWGVLNALSALNWDTAGVPPSHAGLRMGLLSSNPLRAGDGPAVVRYAIPDGGAPGIADVAVFDAGGRRVRTIAHHWLDTGQWRTASWDGTDDDGRPARAGLYLLAFRAGDHRSTVRLALLR